MTENDGLDSFMIFNPDFSVENLLRYDSAPLRSLIFQEKKMFRKP